MIRAIGLIIAATLFSSSAAGDLLVLRDGRTFNGVVTVREDAAEVELPHGILRFSRAEVLRVELTESPQAQLVAKLAGISGNDPDALLAVARWAADNDLRAEADKLHAEILRIAPDHAATRRDLGHMKIEGQWRDLNESIELARGKLEAGEHQVLLKEIMPELAELARPQDKLLQVRDIQGHAQLRARMFEQAAATFEVLAKAAAGPAAVRYAAIVEILKENTDGMYILMEPYPPNLALLGGQRRPLQAGPASLADPLVLEAALRDRAKEQIGAGRDLLAAAKALEPSDPEAAKAKYFQASRTFGEADAIVDGIARTYRVEITRRLITVIRGEADADARKFDSLVAKLGTREISPQTYRVMVTGLVRNLDDVRQKLGMILTIAKPYPNDLVLEIQWAETDIRKIESMRNALVSEFDGDR